MDHNSRFLTLVNQTKRNIPEISISELKARLNNLKSKFHLIDIREDSEWAAGAIPGAIHLGKGIIERDIEKTFPDTDTKLVLYCGGGYRSLLAADSLQKMGYTQVYSLAGGYRDWCEANT